MIYHVFMNTRGTNKSLLSRTGCLIAAMAPKGKGRAAAAPPKRKGAMQSQLNQLPLLKKPSELIGTQIKVPGAYWDGRMSDEEKAMLWAQRTRRARALRQAPARRALRRIDQSSLRLCTSTIFPLCVPPHRLRS